MQTRRLISLAVAVVIVLLLLEAEVFRKEPRVDLASFHVGNWMVYSDAGNQGVLTALNTQTKQRKVLTEHSTYILDVALGKVYYYDFTFRGTFRVDPSAESIAVELVTSERPDSLAAVNDSVYYVSNADHALYVLEMGTPEARLVSSAYCDAVKTDGLWVYFINVSLDNALQRIHIQSTQDEIMHPGRVSEYQLSEDGVFFILADEAGKLFRMSKEGAELTELYGETVYDLHVLNDEVYFHVGPAGRLFKMDLDGSNLTEVSPRRR